MIIYLTNILKVGIDDIPTEKLSSRAEKKFSRLSKTAPLKAVQTAVADLIISYYKKQNGISSEISENDFGKPYFVNSSVNFSVSHSEEIVAVSFSDSKHGIDVERLRSVDEKTARAVLSPLKYLEYLQAEQAEKDKIFVREFTEKESYVKYLGEGLSVRPSLIKPENVYFLTKYLFRDASVYCLTICLEESEKFSFEPLSVRELLKR